ncbi:hypothetical protein GRI89_14740 [Altererythrobacter salegens]|uniref:PilZ domain-containing protein n=1 Tax=Croceibacterium salegens TaxID=1737568 RepID=A0A6I4SZD9_9SPHN|nr:PilZ domain-containing protein [Croceibacterium salegens]MXO60798.1 hypothetical protein [Croceibacterium salegens]
MVEIDSCPTKLKATSGAEMSQTDEVQPNRRSSSRRETHVETIMKDAKGSFCRGTIDDISEEGCAITIRHGHPVLERIYSIKFANLEIQAGFVAWTQDGKAGMGFLAPLHPSVVDSIVARFPPVEDTITHPTPR